MIFSEVVEFHVIYSFPDPTLPREVCQPETFIAKCDDQSVIVMETAFYGRMKEGRWALLLFYPLYFINKTNTLLDA